MSAGLAELAFAYPEARADEQRRVERAEALATAVEDSQAQLQSLRDEDVSAVETLAAMERDLQDRPALKLGAVSSSMSPEEVAAKQAEVRRYNVVLHSILLFF